jgi:hypothetical protein
MARLQGFHGAHQKVVCKEPDPMTLGRRVRSHEMHETLHCFMCNYATERKIDSCIASLKECDYAW